MKHMTAAAFGYNTSADPGETTDPHTSQVSIRGPPLLAFTIEGLAIASGVGRTSIFAAIKAGELETITPVIAGKRLKRRLIPVAVAEQWVSGFPVSESAK